MLQLRVLSGTKAGEEFTSSRFPVQIGRAPDCHLVLEEPGVWDRHFEILFESTDGLTLKAHSDAWVTINGQQVRQATLRNGDEIILGTLRLRFGLSPVRQRSHRVPEVLTWLALAGLSLGQVFLIYQLSR